MMPLLVVFVFIDILIAFFTFRQAFVERSNMNRKYRVRFVIMLVIVLTAILLKGINLPLACLTAGIPAGLMVLFMLGMGIAMLLHKGPWN